MAPRRERFQRLKDALEAHRGMIVYTIVALVLMGAAVGWGLLPDMVSMAPEVEDPYFLPKERLLLLHFGMAAGFSGLFWKWPREIAYLFGAVVGLLLTFALLYLNMGV